MNKDKRKEIRIPLINEFVGVTKEDNLVDQFQLSDISPIGCFIQSNKLKRPGEIIELVFSLPGDLGLFRVKAIVKQVKWAMTKKSNRHKGYGVEFDFEGKEDNIKIMNSYSSYLRNHQIIKVSKRILETYLGLPVNNSNPPVDLV